MDDNERTFESLLTELDQSHIFKYLDIDDILALKVVSKNLYSIVDSYDIEELWICTSPPNYKENWFTTTCSTILSNQIEKSRMRILLEPPNNFLNLKYLRIEGFKKPLKLTDINKFTKLEIIHIWFLKGFSPSDYLLQLPELKALSTRVDMRKDQGDDLVIDTPKLKSLDFYSYCCDPIDSSLVKFTNPGSLKYLKIGRFEKRVKMFTNLECLELTHLSHFTQEDLSNLKKLKKLKIDNLLSLNEFEGLKELFRSKKADLDIVLAGVLIECIEKIDEYRGYRRRHEFQLNNYDDLDDLSFEHFVHYNDLVRVLPDTLPTDLFSYYNNVIFLIVSSAVEDENQLIDFIRGCSSLSVFQSINSSLSQQFYDQLPEVCLLTGIKVFEDAIDLNFAFLLNMPYLSSIDTNQDAQIHRDLNLNDLKRLKSFNCKIRNKVVSVRRKNIDEYYIKYGLPGLDIPDQDYLSLVELIEVLDRFRERNEEN